MGNYLFEELTQEIIRCCYNVYDELGSGFLESVYENALALELESVGLKVEQQKGLDIFYKGNVVGNFRTDLVVEDKVIIELKAVSNILKVHEVQLVNYLKGSRIKVGLIVNFGEELKFKRKYFDRH